MDKTLDELIRDISFNKYISGTIILKANGIYSANLKKNNGLESIYGLMINKVTEVLQYWKTSDIGFDLEINFNLNKQDSFVVNTYENITIEPPVSKSDILTPFFKKENKKYSKCSLEEIEEYIKSIKDEGENINGYYR